MPAIDLTPDQLLTTTRSIRRRRMDLQRPVDREALAQCVEIALQAAHVGALEMGNGGPPHVAAGLRSRVHFVVVTDAAQRAALAGLFRRAMAGTAEWRERHFADVVAEGRTTADGAAQLAAFADDLAEHLHEVPAHVIPCIAWRPEGLPVASQAALWGSVYPAIWSFLLAARARGMAGIITTTHLQLEREAAEVLGLPFDEVTQAALIPIACTSEATFQPHGRPPVEAAVHWDRW